MKIVVVTGVLLLALMLVTLGGCASPFGAAEQPAPIEDRAHPRAAVAHAASPTVVKTTPLAEQPRFITRPLTTPSAPQGARVLPAPQLAMIDRSRQPPLSSVPLVAQPLSPADLTSERSDEEQAKALGVLPAAPALSPAVQSLVTAANTAAAQHNWDQAQAALERAVKLAPSKSSVWQQLANTHLQSGNLERAREVAQRALSLAAADGRENVAAWRLIGDIEQARGDASAAQLARATAARLTH